jgi:HD-GYP domain-containing protein (c-di-GMP phosphodiesterase class II)
MRLASVLRIGRVYEAGNQAVTRQLQLMLDSLRPWLDELGGLTLIAMRDDLFLNGIRLPVRSTHFVFHQLLLEELSKRHIAGLRLMPGLQAEELEAFFALFLKPDEFLGEDLLAACSSRGLRGIQPIVHASTVPTVRSVAAAGTTPTAADAGPAGGGGRGRRTCSAFLGAPCKAYFMAVEGARSLLSTTALQGSVELRHAKRIVQPLVDEVLAGEPVVQGLAGLVHHDDFTYSHAANVCLVAITVGHHLGLDRRALADLGVAAIFHDVGKATACADIQNPLESLTEAEQAALRRHPAEGARLIAASTSLNLTMLRAIRVAFEHHATVPGGYPAAGEGWQPSVLSEIVALADCYVTLTTHRSERGAHLTLYEALGMVLGPLGHQFDPALRLALVLAVGFYPPGQLVELNDGTLAVVLAPDARDPARPHVRVVTTAAREPLRGSDAPEHHPLPAHLVVRRALSGDEYPDLSEHAAA